MSIYFAAMATVAIFDFDGVIADTENSHLNSFRKVLKPFGIKISKTDYFSKYLALDDKTFFKTVFEQNRKRWDEKLVASLIKEKSTAASSLMANCVFFEGALELVRALSEQSFTLAVASGALKHEIETALANGRVLEFFSAIVSAEDCENCKPDPEPFVRALREINKKLRTSRDAKQCVVIEDSPHGICAAKAAGMKCIAVTNSHPRTLLSQADLTVESLLEISPAIINSL